MEWIPMVADSNESYHDMISVLLLKRIVLLNGDIEPLSSNLMISQWLYVKWTRLRASLPNNGAATAEEALIAMYLAGVLVRRIEVMTKKLWGAKVSPGTVGKLNKKGTPRSKRK